jgi:hypothetical protein
MTTDELGEALGVAGNTIRAIECGARSFTKELQARAEAFFRIETVSEIPRPPCPPDGLVVAEAWIDPETLGAALAEAQRRDVDLARVIGDWVSRPR